MRRASIFWASAITFFFPPSVFPTLARFIPQRRTARRTTGRRREWVVLMGTPFMPTTKANAFEILFHSAPPFHSSKPRTGRAVMDSAQALNFKTRERGRAGQLPRLARISAMACRQSPLCVRICRTSCPVKPGNVRTENNTARAVFGFRIAPCQSLKIAVRNSEVFTPHRLSLPTA